MQRCEMPANEDGPILIVAEAGCAWTIWAAACRARPNDVTVIAQHPSEEPREFAGRATERITRFCCAQWKPQVAVLALAAVAFDGSFVARTQLARALLDSMRGTAGNELLLAGDPECRTEARREILGLAQTLTESMLGVPIAVRVDFTGHALPAQRPLAHTAPRETPRRMRVA